MKKLTFIISLFLLSCGTPSGFLRDSRTSQVFSHRMDIRALRLIKQVRGESSVLTIFCTIPTRDASLYAEAMESLVMSANLQTNQTLVNLREDKINRFVAFVCMERLTVSADVIEFVPK